MKKLFSYIAALLALILFALPGMAEASAWSNGQSPSQPYKGVPPADLTQKLGYMVLDPLNKENVNAPLTSLKIYLPREDVKAGAGSLKLYETGAKAPLETIALSDASRVTVEKIDSQDLAWLYWESGVCFTIQLKDTLDADKSYYASLDQGAIVATDYKGVESPALDGQKGWAFTTNADAGALSRTRSGGEEPKVGDTVTIQVKLGGGTASATVFCDTDAVVSSDQPLAQTGALTARYAQAGAVKWGVALTDASGALLYVYHYEDQVRQ
jgi:uncharacterized membrane protein